MSIDARMIAEIACVGLIGTVAFRYSVNRRRRPLWTVGACIVPSLLFFLINPESPRKFAARHLVLLPALLVAIAFPSNESDALARMQAAFVGWFVAQAPVLIDGPVVETADAVYQMPGSFTSVTSAVLLALILGVLACRTLGRTLALVAIGFLVGVGASFTGFLAMIAPLHRGKPPHASYPSEPFAIGSFVLLVASVYLAVRFREQPPNKGLQLTANASSN